MSLLSPSTLRPTIIVGYGDHGRECLRHLLSSTATRGVLQWEAVRDGVGSHERRLKHLRLIHLPHAFEEGSHAGASNDEDNVSLDLMKDLYGQIRTVALQMGDDPSEALAQALHTEASSLLSVSNAAQGEDRAPLGLDVFVLVRPQNELVLGGLTNTLRAGMDRLSALNNLVGQAAGAARLNFVQFLDFDHYWGPKQRALRRSVKNILESWEGRAAKGQPAFARTWLVDGQSDLGMVSHPQRIDQLVLFLEFLLFEDQRTDRQFLYQRGSQVGTGVGTFGIHLLERSSGLLRRLSASIFAVNWLEHLASAAGPVEPRAHNNLAKRLEAWSPAALDELLGTDSLRDQLDASLESLRIKLSALSAHSEAWPTDAHKVAQEHLHVLKRALEATACAELQKVDAERVGQLRNDLRQCIDQMLHQGERSVALGRVIRELSEFLDDVRIDRDDAAAVPWPAEVPQTLVVLHRDYRAHLLRELDTRRTVLWWPMLAVFLTIVAAPMLSGLLYTLPDTSTGSLKLLANPLITHLALGVPALGLGVWAQTQVRKRVERARQFWTDPHQGRFADGIRAATSRQGAWGAPVYALLDERIDDMKASVRAAVCRELEDALDQLKLRQNEVNWLRSQLRALLQNFHIDPESFGVDALPGTDAELHLQASAFRATLEKASELQRILARNPPTPERFRSTQDSRRPFKDWQDRYCPTFLHPFAFIDELSVEYRDPQQDEAALAYEGPLVESARDEVCRFVSSIGTPKLSFNWFYVKNSLPPEHLALFPKGWLSMQGVRPDLQGAGFTDAAIVTGPHQERGYLLSFRLGFHPADMEEVSS